MNRLFTRPLAYSLSPHHTKSSNSRCRIHSTSIPDLSTPPPPPPSSSSDLTHWRVTLLRTPLGLPKPFHDTVRVLGLKKRMSVRYHLHSRDVAGLILKVKELVKVENVTRNDMEMGMKSSRKLQGDDRGYKVLNNVLSDKQKWLSDVGVDC